MHTKYKQQAAPGSSVTSSNPATPQQEFVSANSVKMWRNFHSVTNLVL